MADDLTKPATTTAPATPPKAKVYFGVALELAGKVIALEPKNAITELLEKGIEVELPPGERVYLGTVGKSLESILKSLGVSDDDITGFLDKDTGTFKKDVLPNIDALQNAANLVLGAGLFVNEFHVKLPGTEPTATSTVAPNSKERTAYTVGLSAEWLEDAGSLISGLDLKLRGIYLKVSNEA